MSFAGRFAEPSVGEGKTKMVRPGPQAGTVLLQAKDQITAGDAARVDEIGSIGIMRTAQAANVATLLAASGVPTAFLKRADERSLLCWNCEMIPVEFVVRRVAWGSYLKRHPAPDGPEPAERFPEIVVERFLKDALVVPPAVAEPIVMRESEARSKFLKDGQWAQGVHTDPYVEVAGDNWRLHPAKRPIRPGKGALSIPAPITPDEDREIRESILVPAFRCLEQAWRYVQSPPIVLVDAKFEIGRRRTDGALVLADVVDNDSWRIWPGGDPDTQLDKQNFRDGRPLAEVTSAYARVTELTERFAELIP